MMKDQIPACRHLRRPQQNHNKKRVVWIVALLLLSVEIPEIPTYIIYLHPEVKTVNKDWFIFPEFHFKIAEYWYFKFTCERIAWMCRMIAFTKTAVQYSTAVFLASFIILCYLAWDLAMFWCNYNTWIYVYEFMILFVYVIGRSLVRPFKPDAYAKIKSLF